jgi:hypothetical protein
MQNSSPERIIRRATGTALAIVLVALAACGNGEPDNDAATTAFVECLERNGVDARDVRVTLDEDGSVSGIEAVILNESGSPYEPAVRLACTQEVEGR